MSAGYPLRFLLTWTLLKRRRPAWPGALRRHTVPSGSGDHSHGDTDHRTQM